MQDTTESTIQNKDLLRESNLEGQCDRGIWLPKVGKTYKHRKGGIYKVLAIATHSETLDELVIYQNTLNLLTWARPMEMFCDGRFEEVVNG